jgi:hypothetical protein
VRARQSQTSGASFLQKGGARLAAQRGGPDLVLLVIRSRSFDAIVAASPPVTRIS